MNDPRKLLVELQRLDVISSGIDAEGVLYVLQAFEALIEMGWQFIPPAEEIEVVNHGDHLKLHVHLVGATIRINSFEGHPLTVEAVVWAEGDLAFKNDEGWSPLLSEVDPPSEWESQLLEAIDRFREEHGRDKGRIE